jgi:hypothetical protein
MTICQDEHFGVTMKLSRAFLLMGILLLNAGCGGGSAGFVSEAGFLVDDLLVET